MTPPQQPEREKHPRRCETCGFYEITVHDDKFCKVTGEELAGEIEIDTHEKYGCCSHSEMTRKYDSSLYFIGESEIDAGRNAVINILKMGGLNDDQIIELKVISKQFQAASNHPIRGDEQVRRELLDSLITWLEPQSAMLLKQRMYRKLLSLKDGE